LRSSQLPDWTSRGLYSSQFSHLEGWTTLGYRRQ